MSTRFQQSPAPTSRYARQVSVASTFSVYSTTPPSMSRTSSEQVLDTPLGEYLPGSLSFDGKQPTRFDERIRGKRATNSHKDMYYHRSTADSPLSDEPVYHFPNSTPYDCPSPLGYRRSARELISKYEAISSPSTRPAPKHLLTQPTPNLQRRNSPLPELPPSTKPKAQTPFSFRNLLTVFAKKNKSPKPAQLETCVPDVKPVIPSQSEDVFLTSSPFRTGPALYLSCSTHPPTWHSCILTLHPSHLALTFSEDARRITHTIPLLFCVDVASLASHQLGREIPKPSMGGDKETDKVANVFEMTFEGCKPAKERLAAWSVAERGRWVSAIWDAILACRDPNTAQNDVRVASPNDIIRGPPLKVVNGTSQPSSSASSPSIAPQHVTNEQTQIQRPSSPISSFSVPTTPTRRRRALPSEPSSAPSSLPSSSSIQTLGSMSIVRQRLAELDPPESSQYEDSPSGGISGQSRSYVTSSKRRTKGAEEGGRQDVYAFASKSSNGLEWGSTTTTSKFSHDGASQETSFTALDAHAMYHQSHHEQVDSETSPKYHFGERKSQISGNRNTNMPIETAENLERGMRSLLQSFRGHAAEQTSQASGLADRLTSLDDGVKNIVDNLKTLPQGTSDIDIDLTLVHAKLDEIRNGLATIDIGTLRTPFQGMDSTSRARGDLPAILRQLEDLKAPCTVSEDLAPVLAMLEEIMIVMRAQGDPSKALSSSTSSETEHLKNIGTKLDGLIALCTTLVGGSKTPIESVATDSAGNEVVMHNLPRSRDSDGISGDKSEYEEDETFEETTEPASDSIPDREQVTKLLELLQDDNSSRATQAQQQTESVRYLNELNAWLENFVTNSVGNMRHVATGVDQLRKEWLPVEAANSTADEGEDVSSPANIFTSLQLFLAKQEEKSEERHDLQIAMQSLTEILKKDMEKNAEARFEMLRHAQVQESLLNGLASELTKEIRGERLRFVDAMKDATSVNVAVHVEEFKRVLGKLHHEKMVLEQQIAELFSFVAKQKQGIPPQPNRTTSEVPGLSRPLPQINKQNPPGYIANGRTS